MFDPQLAVSYGEELVDIGGFALWPTLEHASPTVIILIALFMAIIKDALHPILFIPDDGAPSAIGVMCPPSLISIGIISKGPLANVCCRMGLRSGVAIRPVVACLGLGYALA